MVLVAMLVGGCIASVGIGVGLGLRGSSTPSILPDLMFGDCGLLRLNCTVGIVVEADPACIRKIYNLTRRRGSDFLRPQNILVDDLSSTSKWRMPCEGAYVANYNLFRCEDSQPQAVTPLVASNICACGERELSNKYSS